MKIEEIIHILENKLSFLNIQKTISEAQGDLLLVEKISEEILNTELSLLKLKS
jgi:hypothetical protein